MRLIQYISGFGKPPESIMSLFLIEATLTALGLDPKPPNVKPAVSRTLFYRK